MIVDPRIRTERARIVVTAPEITEAVTFRLDPRPHAHRPELGGAVKAQHAKAGRQGTVVHTGHHPRASRTT